MHISNPNQGALSSEAALVVKVNRKHTVQENEIADVSVCEEASDEVIQKWAAENKNGYDQRVLCRNPMNGKKFERLFVTTIKSVAFTTVLNGLVDEERQFSFGRVTQIKPPSHPALVVIDISLGIYSSKKVCPKTLKKLAEKRNTSDERRFLCGLSKRTHSRSSKTSNEECRCKACNHGSNNLDEGWELLDLCEDFTISSIPSAGWPCQLKDQNAEEKGRETVPRSKGKQEKYRLKGNTILRRDQTRHHFFLSKWALWRSFDFGWGRNNVKHIKTKESVFNPQATSTPKRRKKIKTSYLNLPSPIREPMENES